MLYPNDYLTCFVQDCVQPLSHVTYNWFLTGESITTAESAGCTCVAVVALFWVG